MYIRTKFGQGILNLHYSLLHHTLLFPILPLRNEIRLARLTKSNNAEVFHVTLYGSADQQFFLFESTSVFLKT
jgi:hypothetical protein